MIFGQPYFFLLLVPIGIILIFMYFQSGKSILFLPLEDIQKIYKNNTWIYPFYYFLVGLICTLFLLIFAQPTYNNQEEIVVKNGIDIEIVFDVSYSMLAKDIQPTRLIVAKDVLSGFLNGLQTDRVGIIVFAGKPFKSLPLSFDYSIVNKILERIDTNTISQYTPSMQGTAIGDALILAADSLFKDDSEREKVIILVTDGTANKGVDPLYALQYIQQSYGKNVKIYTVGVGGEEKTTITLPKELGYQIIEIQGLDEEVLNEISEKTGGKYFRATDKKSFENIFKAISLLEKKEIEIKLLNSNVVKYELFQYLLIITFLLYLFIKMRKRIS